MKAIRITQFIRPNRRRAIIYADVPDELYEKAMLLDISCERITETEVAIYAHVKGESEEDELSEIAYNGPGDNSPNAALERLIKRF